MKWSTSELANRFRSGNEQVEDYESLLYEIVRISNIGERSQLVVEAVEAAKMLHEGQRRADGAPYIIHPLRVASLAASAATPSLVIASTVAVALLHDVVEDCGVDRAWLYERFGAEISDGILLLTAPRKEAETAELRRMRKQQKWEEVKRADRFVQLVNACDVCDNAIAWRGLNGAMPGWSKLPRWIMQAREYQRPILEIEWPEFAKILDEEIHYQSGRGVDEGSWETD